MLSAGWSATARPTDALNIEDAVNTYGCLRWPMCEPFAPLGLNAVQFRPFGVESFGPFPYVCGVDDVCVWRRCRFFFFKNERSAFSLNTPVRQTLIRRIVQSHRRLTGLPDPLNRRTVSLGALYSDLALSHLHHSSWWHLRREFSYPVPLALASCPTFPACAVCLCALRITAFRSRARLDHRCGVRHRC